MNARASAVCRPELAPACTARNASDTSCPRIGAVRDHRPRTQMKQRPRVRPEWPSGTPCRSTRSGPGCRQSPACSKSKSSHCRGGALCASHDPPCIATEVLAPLRSVQLGTCKRPEASDLPLRAQCQKSLACQAVDALQEGRVVRKDIVHLAKSARRQAPKRPTPTLLIFIPPAFCL